MKNLCLSDLNLPNGELSLFEKLENVEVLELKNCLNMSTQNLSSIKQLINLKKLVVSGRVCDDEQLLFLKELVNLREFSVKFSENLKGSFLKELPENIENVHLINCWESVRFNNSIEMNTGECLKNLSQYKNLKNLSLSGKLTSEGLSHLKELKDSLVSLNLASCTRACESEELANCLNEFSSSFVCNYEHEEDNSVLLPIEPDCKFSFSGFDYRDMTTFFNFMLNLDQSGWHAFAPLLNDLRNLLEENQIPLHDFVEADNIIKYCNMMGVNLKYLNLRGYRLSGNQIVQIRNICPNIETLWLAESDINLINNWMNLKRLNLIMYHENNLTDVKSLKNLVNLNLSYNLAIENESVVDLLKELNNLETLNLQGCSCLNEDLFLNWKKINLKEVNIRGMNAGKSLFYLKTARD